MVLADELPEYDPVKVGQRIQELRLQKKVKSIDMAMQLDISKNSYSSIAYGETVCSAKVLHKIAQNLGVSADYLLYGKEDKIYMKQIETLIDGKSPKDIHKVVEVIRIILS
jgi:transcriptional regulator with XRE-family HTH domain